MLTNFPLGVWLDDDVLPSVSPSLSFEDFVAGGGGGGGGGGFVVTGGVTTFVTAPIVLMLPFLADMQHFAAKWPAGLQSNMGAKG
jgi:hypothetical protein